MMDSSRLGLPSRFWQKLSQEHAETLDRHGLESFKRHLALRYFTWRWKWASLRRSEQMRFLLAHSPPPTLFRCVFERPRVADPEWDGIGWSRSERWLYVVAVRLLWEYARKRDQLSILSLPEPELGRPIPVSWRGRLISQDLANTALEAAAIARALDGERPHSILEVGAGYGRTAYALLSAFPDAAYTVVDIEPALTISRWYLTNLFPTAPLRFYQPKQVEQIDDRSIDLAISISSLHEMTAEQLREYLQLFDRAAGGGVVYLKQWQRWTNPEDNITLDFDHYPIPREWRGLFDEPAPVQTKFRQAAWRLPAVHAPL